MSVFTNPSNSTPQQTAAYVEALLNLLGERDVLGVLRDTPAALQAALAGQSPARLTTPEAPGKWSVVHVVQHLADSEIVWGWRMRLILAQDRPSITGYDQDRWAERLHYELSNPFEAIEEFSIVRRANLRLLERTSPADLERVGVHAERGVESLGHLERLYAGHDLLHLRQIDRILGADLRG